MHKLPWIFASAALAGCMAAPALAADVAVTGAWFRSLPADLPAGGYFELHNSGTSPVVLVAAKSSACGMLMLHESTEQSGVSRMRDVHDLTVPAGGTVTFAPGGYHLMCMHPTSAMTPGRAVPVALVFANGGQLSAVFSVKGPTGK
ncbi:MAG: copper chaperone PCu(A)C [Rhizomicrobium sp.]